MIADPDDPRDLFGMLHRAGDAARQAGLEQVAAPALAKAVTQGTDGA